MTMTTSNLKQWAEAAKRVIVLEGPDGSGKTTLSFQLHDRLQKLNINSGVAPQPHIFRKLIMSGNVTEEERVALLLEDYDFTILNFLNGPTDILIMDRIPYVSYYIYNQQYVSLLVDIHVGSRYSHIYDPEVVFILNRHSLKEPDDTLFEQRQKQEEIFQKYNNFDPRLMYDSFVQLVFNDYGGLKETAQLEETTDWIISYLEEIAYWNSGNNE